MSPATPYRSRPWTFALTSKTGRTLYWLTRAGCSSRVTSATFISSWPGAPADPGAAGAPVGRGMVRSWLSESIVYVGVCATSG